MNDIIKSLHERKSVRAYTEKVVSAEDKNAILMAAAAAPTAGNQQLYTIIDITDQKIKDSLAITCDNQPFIAKAPMALIFCADVQKWYDAFIEAGCDARIPGPGYLMLAVEDCTIAAQNAVVAAQSLGIGSCYIGDIMENCEAHRELLALPDYVFPAVMLVFGYPTEQQKSRPKPERCDLKHIVHTNHYRSMQGQELRAMFEKHCKGQSFETWMNNFYNRKYNSEFACEMERSVNEHIKPFKYIGDDQT
jgi:FMN reductase (NADPH)